MPDQNVLQTLRLRDRSWESIENKSVAAMQPQPVFNQLHDDLVGHQPAVVGNLRRFKSERSTEVPFASQDCARRSDRDPELTSNHFRLSSFSGTRRAQKHQSPFHLVPVEEDRDAADDQDRDADVKRSEEHTSELQSLAYL